MLASTVRELLGATVDFDEVRDMSTTDTALDQNVWDGLVDVGLVGLHLPEELGGAGFTATEVALVCEELGRFVAAVPYVSSVAASTAVLSGGTDAVKDALLPGLADGSTVGTLAVYESAHAGPSGGSTRIEESDDGMTLTGTKRYVTDAVHADLFVVSADLNGVSVLAVIGSDADGVNVTPEHSLDATRPLGTVEFSRAPLNSEWVITNAESALSDAINMAVVCLSAEQVGGAQRCMETSVEYAKARYQFGRAIGSFQAVKHKCADMLVAVEHARSVAWHAASSIDDPVESAIAVPLAKSVCSDAFLQVAGDTIQVLGGIGFTWEHEAHLYFKRAKSTSLLFGSIDAWRDRLADAIGI